MKINKNSLVQFNVALTTQQMDNLRYYLLNNKNKQVSLRMLLGSTNNIEFMEEKIEKLESFKGYKDYSSMVQRCCIALLEMNETLSEIKLSYIENVGSEIQKNELIVFSDDIYNQNNIINSNFLLKAFQNNMFSILTVNIQNNSYIVFQFSKENHNTIHMRLIEVSKGIFDFYIKSSSSSFVVTYESDPTIQNFTSSKKLEKVAWELFYQYGEPVLLALNKFSQQKLINNNSIKKSHTSNSNTNTSLNNNNIATVPDEIEIIDLNNFFKNKKTNLSSPKNVSSGITKAPHCRKGYWRTCPSGKVVWVNACLIHPNKMNNELNSGIFVKEKRVI